MEQGLGARPEVPIPWCAASHLSDNSGFVLQKENYICMFSSLVCPSPTSPKHPCTIPAPPGHAQHLADPLPWHKAPQGVPTTLCPFPPRSERAQKPRAAGTRGRILPASCLDSRSGNINSSSCKAVIAQELRHRRQPHAAKPLPTAANLLPTLAGSATIREANAN